MWRKSTMPYVTVKMLEGRNEEQKRALVEKVTEAVSETTGAAPEKIVVFIEEMSKNHYGVAGKRLSDE
ncbi:MULTISPECIES: 2-hydroxymuconate tautomerase [Bacillus]|nr:MULTISPECIES: 2-hydroxymuconate tautomerase [Bacillus]